MPNKKHHCSNYTDQKGSKASSHVFAGAFLQAGRLEKAERKLGKGTHHFQVSYFGRKGREIYQVRATRNGYIVGGPRGTYVLTKTHAGLTCTCEGFRFSDWRFGLKQLGVDLSAGIQGFCRHLVMVAQVQAA